MSNKREKKEMDPVLRFLVSVILICAILLLGNYAIRFCMGLFMTGQEYIVTLPGQDSPIVQRPAQTATEPASGGLEGFVSEVARADVLATGDLMMHMPIVNSGKTDSGYNYDSIFKYVSSYISDADYAVVNLETTLAGLDGNEYTGYPKFNSPDAIASAAKNCGFDMLLTGNNHCYDYGTAGLKRTLETLKGYGLATLGTTATAEEPHHAVKDVNGIKVGMVSYTFADIGDNPNQPTLNDLTVDSAAAGLINTFDYDQLDAFYTQMEGHIADMKAKGAEAIVLFIHWGDDYSTTVTEEQKTIAQKMCDLGVDVIAGCHPHVVQPIALLSSTVDESHKTVCMYSMGNFLSNQRATNISLTTGHSEDSVLFNFTFVKYSDGSVYLDSVSLQPAWVLIRGSGDSRQYQILPLNYATGSWDTAYSLSSDQLAEAKASYNRTMELISAGLEEVEAYLSAARSERAAHVSVG